MRFLIENRHGEVTEVSRDKFVDAATETPLRDRFAMAALTGFLANQSLRITERQPGATDSDVVAHAAYAFADAMLRARAK